jgi:hypothetical protein
MPEGEPTVDPGDEPTHAAGGVEEDPDAHLVGTYEIDVDRLLERLKKIKNRRTRAMAGRPKRPTLEDMARAGMELVLHPDRRFALRNDERPEIIEGSWVRMDQKVVMSPDERPRPGHPQSGETFVARIVPGGLEFSRRGLEIPLKRK